ncbi:proximal flagellar hook-filament junction protein [Arcobacter venerupis]|uniref:Flagellar hook-associated protein 1 n=1 Tax=Arcobacter venerupis TaxID=1054033 RepID=A0AAE7B5Y1_9BACT|nr:flagellar basal body rod C-terminal domain-containing protein [Arcobacter venerupis]QKF65923.1 proximal flagellar hook-filament junction protein [Arcobacter venerupis]RWS49282.1 flagellar biosynthesis protein FlgK [Arcobacter venerupis]
MLSTLSVSQSGLNAAKIAVENVSNNIANADTPGYKKRVVQLEELSQMDNQFTGRGVNATGAYRITSQYMYDKLISENTKLSYYDKLSNMTGNIQSIFKETTDSGFSADLNRYYQAVENLRTDPTSQVYKTTLQTQGNILVESLQNLYSSVEQQQKVEKTELSANVNDVNSILKEIGLLNEKMQKFDGVSNDMLDKRDQLELELSNYVDINVNRTDDNYELTIAGQPAVTNTNVRTLNVKEEETLQKDKYTLVDSSVLPPVSYDSLKYNEDFTAKTFDANDVVTYKLNNEFSVSVKMGESITMDWNGDGTETTETVDSSNLTRALVHKINSDPNMKGSITAYNGDYSVDANGNKITKDTQDNYLRIESNLGGSQNQFDGRISIENIDNTDSTIVDKRESIYRGDSSVDPESKVTITINDKEVPIKSGILKAQVDNLSSDSPNNKYQSYLDKLDSFAQTLSDISNEFIKTSSGDYIYGEAGSDESLGTINSMGLFSGSSVKTLKFNEKMVNDLDQNKLDYLATIQWKQNLSFDGKAQDVNSTTKSSLSEFFRDLRVSISADKENIDFTKTTQAGISNSIKSSYDQLTKVDKDEEMLNLIKFQAAYTANAKMITVIDEMLQTLLGLKR